MTVSFNPSIHFTSPYYGEDASLFSVFSGDIFKNFNKATLERLFKYQADVNELEEESGMNFLQKCIVEEFSLHESEGDVFAEIIQLLISEGIDLNHQDDNYSTALHLAIEQNQFDLAKLLLDKGADSQLLDIEDKYPYDYLRKVDRTVLTELENIHYEALFKLFQ